MTNAEGIRQLVLATLRRARKTPDTVVRVHADLRPYIGAKSEYYDTLTDTYVGPRSGWRVGFYPAE